MKTPRRATILAFSMVALLLLAACGSAISSEQAMERRTASQVVATDPPFPTSTSEPTTEIEPTATDQDPVATSTRPAPPSPEQTATPDESERGLEIVTLLPQDGIPSIDNPKFYDVQEADQEYLPDELILGVEADGEARAYSVDLLSRHEIVNDTLAGHPIAITW
jgi:hypothetical protein